MATTTPRMKITYATLSADNEELQSAFDAAVERVRGELGRSYPMLIGAEQQSGGNKGGESHGPSKTDKGEKSSATKA